MAKAGAIMPNNPNGAARRRVNLHCFGGIRHWALRPKRLFSLFRQAVALPYAANESVEKD